MGKINLPPIIFGDQKTPNTIERCNADEAISLIKEEGLNGIGLVITDVEDPSSSRTGIDLLRFLRSQFPNLPIVVMSGEAHYRKKVEALSGIFLGKPFRIAALKGAIEKAVQKVSE